MATDDRVAQAAAQADKASDVAGRLKTGSWESAQTLALISIANSLAVLAERAAQAPGDRIA